MAETWKSGVMGELDPLIGRTISGRYRVHALLGQGGMGKVFQAQQIPLGRAVALKVLSAEYEGSEDPEFHKRFFREAAILARLKSPHTVTVFDYGRDGETYYIAMELVTGEPIDRVLEMQGPMQPARALGIAHQVCRSLREAHAQGIIHRDLKPGNVLISHSDDGEEIVKVLDFGLATRMTVVDDTNPNLVPGSPKYMPPEAIRQGTVDGRSDIYSLGVMLYQMLGGVVPFDRPNPMDILVAHLRENPRPLRETNPRVNVPEAFERLVMRCLAKNPDDRFSSMQEVIDALRSLAAQIDPRAETTLAGERSVFPPGGEPSGPQLRLQPGDVTPSSARARSRFSGVQVFMAVAGLTAMVGTGVALWLSWPVHEPPPAPDEPVVAEPAPEPPPQRQPAAQDEAPDMVFSEAELAEQESEAAEPEVPSTPIEVTVTSVPPEANLIFRGKIIGVTPTTFEYEPARQAKGRPLMMRLEKEGFETKYVRQDLEPGATEVSISEYLIPSPDAPPAAEGPQDDAPLRRAEPATEAPTEPVMKVTPSRGADHDRTTEGADDDETPETP